MLGARAEVSPNFMLRWQYTDADVVVVVFAVVAKAAFKPRKGNKLNFEY